MAERPFHVLYAFNFRVSDFVPVGVFSTETEAGLEKHKLVKQREHDGVAGARSVGVVAMTMPEKMQEFTKQQLGMIMPDRARTFSVELVSSEQHMAELRQAMKDGTNA